MSDCIEMRLIRKKMTEEEARLYIKEIINDETEDLPTYNHFDLVLDALLDKHIDLMLAEEAKKHDQPKA
jgi:hypothetical protein